MESVEKQIAQLLERNDCVQVPDFGGFVLNRMPSVFGSHSHELLAPGKSIGFNRNLQMNDGLLCSHISNWQKIPYAEAQALVAEQVKNWKNILNSGQILNLENIGALQQDAAEKWQFTPFALKNFDVMAYGLTSLQLKPVEQQTYTQKLEKNIKTKAKALPKGRKIWLQRAVYTTITAVSLTLGFLIFDEIRFQHTLMQQQNLAAIDKPAVDKTVNEEVTSTPQISETLVAETEAQGTAAESSKFYVIGGAFSSVANANKFAQQLEKKGYKAEVLDNENGLTRVAYTVEADSLTADQQLQKIKQQENHAAWLLKW